METRQSFFRLCSPDYTTAHARWAIWNDGEVSGALGAARPIVFGSLIKSRHTITLNYDNEERRSEDRGAKWGQGESELLGNVPNLKVFY